MRPIRIRQPHVDNALLASCDRTHSYAVKESLWAGGSGVAVGCVRFLCVAFRSGALAWPF